MTLRNRPPIEALVEALPFIQTVDLMLLEGAPAPDVAKFIHDDQNALTEIPVKALGDALQRRRKKLRDLAMAQSSEQTRRWFETNNIGGVGLPPDDKEVEEDDDEDDGPGGMTALPQIPPASSPNRGNTPSAFAQQIYKRTVEGIEELVELEALYRTSRYRIDRLVQIEDAKNGYIENLHREVNVASELLMKRVAVKEKMGLIDGDAKFREQLDLAGYSKTTVAVLSKPESRHRVVSLVDRLRQIEEKKQAAEVKKREAAGG